MPLRVRRLGFAAVNVLTWAAFLAALWRALGWCWLTPVLVGCTAMFLPWYVLGLWNTAIGLPVLFRARPRRPAGAMTLRTAIVMTVRNEDATRAVTRLRIIEASLDAIGAGDRFGFFLLSDTADPAIAAQEQAAMQAWRQASALPERLHYRRRTDNTGFKAGNVMEFARNHAAGFDAMVTLDADSLMSGPAIVHLVQLMQAQPRTGIIQGLVTGLPATSAFTRLFQFGMRHGMRTYTAGQAWWTGDCGPFWGHNAIIRIAPFRAHCVLPVLPGPPPFGGPIMSHDQVEAALMRAAGWEVRLQPVVGGSYEDNPPTLLDYISRDLRWCQGNLQYVRLLRLAGLQPVSRFQLLWAILMFAGLPGWTLSLALLPIAALVVPLAHPGLLAALYGFLLLMDVAPKLAGYVHTACNRRRAARYGGLPRFLLGSVTEIVFSWLKYGITALRTTGFIVALLCGRHAAWMPQRRDARTVSWREAAGDFWPETIFGTALYAALLATAPALLPWVLPYSLGSLLAIPFAVLTASPRLGAWSVRHRLCATPEELDPPPEVAALGAVPLRFGGYPVTRCLKA